MLIEQYSLLKKATTIYDEREQGHLVIPYEAVISAESPLHCVDEGLPALHPVGKRGVSNTVLAWKNGYWFFGYIVVDDDGEWEFHGVTEELNNCDDVRITHWLPLSEVR